MSVGNLKVRENSNSVFVKGQILITAVFLPNLADTSSETCKQQWSCNLKFYL